MHFDINTLIQSLSGEEGLDKQASEVAATPAVSVADELKATLMTKSASTLIETADDLGRQLARRLLEKAASDTQVSSEPVLGDNLSALAASVEATLNKEAEEIQPQAQVVAETNAATADAQGQVDEHALQSGGTVEGQLHESIHKGLTTPSAVATVEDTVDLVSDNMQKAAAVSELVNQGMSFYDAADLVSLADSELQKEAAFAELTAEGYSFDDATQLIKAASEGHVSEEMSKQASFSELLASGYTFDDAVSLVKEADLKDFVVRNGMKGIIAGRMAKEGVAQAGGKIASTVAANKSTVAGLGAAAATGAVAGAATGSMTKKAALVDLMNEGYTFTQALAAVQA